MLVFLLPAFYTCDFHFKPSENRLISLLVTYEISSTTAYFYHYTNATKETTNTFWLINHTVISVFVVQAIFWCPKWNLCLIDGTPLLFPKQTTHNHYTFICNSPPFVCPFIRRNRFLERHCYNYNNNRIAIGTWKKDSECGSFSCIFKHPISWQLQQGEDIWNGN